MKKRLSILLAIILSLALVASVEAGGTFSRVKTWATGETLTASDLNAEFDNIITNATPAGIDDASADATAMQATTDPYPAGVASLATSLLGEIQRIRYVLAQITGETYWYQDPDSSIATLNAAVFPVGATLDYFGATAPTGWLLCTGGTIGDATSGGTLRANADTTTLFALLWDSTTNTELVIQDSSGTPTTRGASAAADFAAHKRMPLPDLRGRMALGKDNMGGSSANRQTAAAADLIAGSGGQETHVHTTGDVTLTAAQSGLPAHTHDVAGKLSNSGTPDGISAGVNEGGATATGAVTGGAQNASQPHNHGNTGNNDWFAVPYITVNKIIKY